jgi:hypothetical protein
MGAISEPRESLRLAQGVCAFPMNLAAIMRQNLAGTAYKGCYLSVEDDLEALLAQAQAVRSEERRALRLRA